MERRSLFKRTSVSCYPVTANVPSMAYKIRVHNLEGVTKLNDKKFSYFALTLECEVPAGHLCRRATK